MISMCYLTAIKQEVRVPALKGPLALGRSVTRLAFGRPDLRCRAIEHKHQRAHQHSSRPSFVSEDKSAFDTPKRRGAQAVLALQLCGVCACDFNRLDAPAAADSGGGNLDGKRQCPRIEA